MVVFRRAKPKSIREQIRDILLRLAADTSATIVALFSKDGLPVAVYPEGKVDPVDLSGQGAAMLGACGKVGEGFGMTDIEYVLLKGKTMNVVIVTRGGYGLIVASPEPNIGYLISVARRALSRCEEALTRTEI